MHDQEDLPRQRTPSLGLGAAAYLNQPMVLENPMGIPPGISSPQSAPPNISLLPPTPHNELSEEAVALLAQKPPAPMSAPAITAVVSSAHLPHAHSHCHRPTPQERYTKTSQASTRDNTLQHLQMQVPTGIRSVIVGRKSPVPDRPVGHTDTIDGEQLPPLVPIQLPNSTTTPHGYIKDPHDGQYNLEPKILQPHIQPPHPAARPPAPAFLPRQGSAPPRFGGSRPPTSFANGGEERDRPRSTSASSGPPVQPMRKVSTATDPGIRPSRSRSAAAADAPINSYSSIKPTSSDASIPSTSTLRQQQLKALSDSYNDRATTDIESPSSAEKSSGKGKLSMFGKSDQDKSDEMPKVLTRSNAYAAEKPSSPQRQYNTKPPRPEVGLVPQPFGTPRSPPVSSNTLEEAQVIKHNNGT